MDLATKVNIALCILSFVLAVISIITVVITLLQNSKMIEGSTRPYLCIYGESVNCGIPFFYLVIKNFGNSAATITQFDYTPDLRDCYGTKTECRDFLRDLSSATIAPGQSRICKLDYSKIQSPIEFKIAYQSATKTYHEHFFVDIKSGTSMLTGKVATKEEELRTISYTLQEMLQKSL